MNSGSAQLTSLVVFSTGNIPPRPVHLGFSVVAGVVVVLYNAK